MTEQMEIRKNGELVMVQQQEAADHRIVRDFFSARGLIAEPIPETKTGKKPDFEIKRGAELVAFCEVKSPQDIFTERVTNAITSGKGGIIETGWGNDYRQTRCIDRAAQKAAAQFDAVNPFHSIPNILIVVNHDEHANVDDFVQLTTGTFGGASVAKGIQNEIPQIDLYVWIDQKYRRSEQEPRVIYNHRSPLKETVCTLLKL